MKLRKQPKNSSRRQTLSQALNQATDCLRLAKINSASLDAELLLAQVLKKPRSFILSHPEKFLSDPQYKSYHLLITRRTRGYPIAYLSGVKEFYGLEFKVSEATLVPRPESELLVEEALRFSKPQATVIDIGTGSGCLIISVLKRIPNKGYALDISSKALAVAKANAKKHGLSKKITFKKSDLISNLKIDSRRELVIIANLPYLTLKQMKEPSIRREPKTALAAGTDGLKYYRRLAKQLAQLPNPYTLLCEINPGQKNGFKKLFPAAEFKKDLSGRVRIGKVNME